MKEKPSASPPQQATEVREVKWWRKLPPKGHFSKSSKLFGEVWKRQQVMDNNGIVQKKRLYGPFLSEKKIALKPVFWHGCYGNILYNICAEKWYFYWKYVEKKFLELSADWLTI